MFVPTDDVASQLQDNLKIGEINTLSQECNLGKDSEMNISVGPPGVVTAPSIDHEFTTLCVYSRMVFKSCP